MWAFADEGDKSPYIKADEHSDTFQGITVNSFEP